MFNIETILHDLVERKTTIIWGKEYEVRDCIFAADGDILKVNLYLVSADSELTIFSELRSFPKKEG